MKRRSFTIIACSAALTTSPSGVIIAPLSVETRDGDGFIRSNDFVQLMPGWDEVQNFQ